MVLNLLSTLQNLILCKKTNNAIQNMCIALNIMFNVYATANSDNFDEMPSNIAQIVVSFVY
jgi:hypothetical protein